MTSLGAVYPQIELRGDPDELRSFAAGLERLGFDYLSTYEHVLGADQDRTPPLWGPYGPHDPFHDPFVMFAHVAALTSTLGLSTGVLVLPQRQTALAARQAADLQLLSGGRFRLGVGVGWNYVEYEALGQDFRTRGRRIDEQIELMRRLWTQDLVDFDGEFDRVDRAALLPRPRTRIPIWIGGNSEPAYRRAGTNLEVEGFVFAGDLLTGLTGLARLREHAKRANRDIAGFGFELTAASVAVEDPSTVRATNERRTSIGVRQLTSSVDATARTAREWWAAGGTHFAIHTMGLGLKSAEAHLEFLASVKDRLPQ